MLYYLQNGSVQKQLLRVSLKKVEDQLQNVEEIIRCQRSYLVNKLNIRDITGNARSLNILMREYEGMIPVSRSFPKEALGGCNALTPYAETL